MPRPTLARVRAALVLSCALAACDEPPVVAAERAEPPPTGQYEITTRVVSDSCSPAYEAPAPWRTRVLANAEGERVKVNLPLAAIPPSTATTSQSRSDFVLEAGYTFEHHLTPVAGCDAFTIDAKHTMKSVGADSFTTSVEVTYGDPGSCTVPGPTRCTTVVEYDHRLVESECAARCTYGTRARPPGPAAEIVWDVDCRC